MKYITTLILMFFIAGCAPYMTYEEMDDAYEIAETQEEKDAMRKKLDTFEANAEKARIYFDGKLACQADQQLTWFCKGIQATNMKRVKDLDGLVRAYKREYQSCGCNRTADMNSLLRRY
jgi:hypothetical protein